jgi:hypothetical protein
VNKHSGIDSIISHGAVFQYSTDVERKLPITTAIMASHKGSKPKNREYFMYGHPHE